MKSANTFFTNFLFIFIGMLGVMDGYSQTRKPQVHAILGIYTHHETFSCACGENWQSNWLPLKFNISLPVSDRVSLFPAVAVGKASVYFYQPQTFVSIDVNAKFNFIKYDYWIRPYIFGGIGTAYFANETYATNEFVVKEGTTSFYGSLNIGLGFNLWLSDKYGVSAQHSLNVLPSYSNYYQASIGVFTQLDALFGIYNPNRFRRVRKRTWI